jgi:hypothetical protein
LNHAVIHDGVICLPTSKQSIVLLGIAKGSAAGDADVFVR